MFSIKFSSIHSLHLAVESSSVMDSFAHNRILIRVPINRDISIRITGTINSQRYGR